MDTRFFAALIVSVGAVAAIVAAEWPTLSPATYTMLGGLVTGGLAWLAPSPLKGGPS